MRSVRIVVRQMAGSVPALVAASVLGGASCGEGISATPVAASGGASSSAGSSSISIAGAISMAGASPGNPYPPGCDAHIIELPEAGMPADPGQICVITVEPVMKDSAARVTLSATPEQLRTTAAGKLTLAPELLASVAGAPVLQIVGATDPKLVEAKLSELTESDDGYTFTVTWPENVRLEPQTSVSFRTAFDLACESGARLVHAVTNVQLCGGFSGVPSTWASPGDNCVTCEVIAELAASPIIPGHETSALPLGQAMRARVVELARVGQSVVLFAENDGGTDSSYEWHASTGKLEQIAPDLVIWHLEPSDVASSMQVAIVGEAGVAVVSYEFQGGMH